MYENNGKQLSNFIRKILENDLTEKISFGNLGLSKVVKNQNMR